MDLLNPFKSRDTVKEKSKPVSEKKEMVASELKRVQALSVPLTSPSPKGDSMNKPETFFTIQETSFVTRRKNVDKEVKDYALFCDAQLVTCSYTRTEGNGGEKAIRTAALKEIAELHIDELPEEYVKKQFTKNNWNEVLKLLKDNKILLLDFIKWVANNLPKKSGGKRNSGTRVTSSPVMLASILNVYFDNMTDGKPDNKARAEALKALVTDENLDRAVEWLDEKLKECGWNKQEKMSIKVEGKMKEIKNPAFGRVKLQKQN